MAWIDTGGVSLRYSLSGRGKQSLVLFHGLTGSIEIWDATAGHLDGQCRILRADQRGAGLSEKVRTAYTIDDLAGDALAVIEASRLPPPYVLVGHATGASVAVAAGDRLGATVAGYVLCAPALGATSERAKLLLARSEVAVRDGMRAIIDDALSKSYPPAMIRDRQVYDGYRARVLAIDPVCYAAANRVLAGVNLDTALSRIAAPCLLVAGEHDLMRPPDVVAAAAHRISHATTTLIDSGHIMPLQAPDALAAAISTFIAQLSESQP